MTAAARPTDAELDELLEDLEDWHSINAHHPHATPGRAKTAIIALRRGNDALREALRSRVVVSYKFVSECCLCCSEWDNAANEKHAPGCLAAPPKEKE